MIKFAHNTSGVILFLVTLTRTLAQAAAPLPVKLAARANELQRSVWACEAGGQSLAVHSKATGLQSRFFLGTVDDSANKRDKPPLILQGTHLSGLGSLSDNRGWSNIQFDCTLSPGLREAKTFKFDVVSPVATNHASLPAPNATRPPDGNKATWYVSSTGPVYLFHGIKETDDRDFIASCVQESGEIRVALTNTVKWLKKDNYVMVSIMSGPGAGLYIARGVPDENLGSTMPVFMASHGDPLLHWMKAGSSLPINIESETVYDVSLARASQAVDSFSAACH